MEAIEAIEAKKELERIVRLKKNRPKGWSKKVNNAYSRLEKKWRILLKIEPLLEGRERNEAHQVLAIDKPIKSYYVRKEGKLEKRVEHQSGFISRNGYIK